MQHKITDVRAKIYRWIGDVSPAPVNFCTNATDILPRSEGTDTMASFKFLGWLVVEVETSSGLVGIGNAALSPYAVKATIDTHLKPLLMGESALDYEYL